MMSATSLSGVMTATGYTDPGRIDSSTGEVKEIVTGKLAVGQAGGATAVINASLVGILEEAAQGDTFSSILGVRRGAEGALQEDTVDLTSLSPGGLQALAQTPGAALQSSRHKLSDDDVDRLLDIFRRLDVHVFLYIGGNDSADTIHRLARRAIDRGQDLQAIAVPKTIDNDLPVTDHSPGYGSIARYIALATMDSAKDTESMPTMYPVKIVEVMGRDAGWVVAASTLGKREDQDAPHLIYVPERRLSREEFLHDVRHVHARFGRVVAVVAETLRDERGRPFADPDLQSEEDAFGHPLIRGTAEAMCRAVQGELGLRARYDKPGGLQRMSMMCASATDLEESRAAGREAVKLALQGVTDHMVTLMRDSDEPYICRMGSTPLANVANRQHLLPDTFLSPDRTGTTAAFRRYAWPLLGPNPLPSYVRLEELL